MQKYLNIRDAGGGGGIFFKTLGEREAHVVLWNPHSAHIVHLCLWQAFRWYILYVMVIR